MKRLLSIVIALFAAALFVLPASAIAHLDGSEPEWDGDPGIRPLMETLDGFEPIVPISGELPDDVVILDGDTVLYIGEPTDELPEEDGLEIDRSHLARGTDAIAEQSASPSVNWVLIIGLGAAGFAVLALAAIVLVKASRKKQA